MISNTGDHAFWMADDEQGNVVVCGQRLIRFRAGSLEPFEEDCPDNLVRLFLEDHVVTIEPDEPDRKPDEARRSLIFPGGKRVPVPEMAAGWWYGSAHDRAAQKFYLLTVNNMLEISTRTLDLRVTSFEHPPDAPHPYYERVVARDGCVAAYRVGLGFWSPLGSSRHDERYYNAATIVGPDRVVAAVERQVVDVYDASGRLLESLGAPPGPIHSLDVIDGEPWIAWVEDLAGEPTLGAEPAGRTVTLGDAEIDVLNVWFEDRVSYAKLLTGDERTVYLGECSVGPHVVIPGTHSVVFGTLEGTLVLWDTRTHEVETIELPEDGSRRNMRIVSMLWCEPRQLLFIGTRDGGVYTARVEPGGVE
jgi:hypothetical protein